MDDRKEPVYDAPVSDVVDTADGVINPEQHGVLAPELIASKKKRVRTKMTRARQQIAEWDVINRLRRCLDAKQFDTNTGKQIRTGYYTYLCTFMPVTEVTMKNWRTGRTHPTVRDQARLHSLLTKLGY